MNDNTYFSGIEETVDADGSKQITKKQFSMKAVKDFFNSLINKLLGPITAEVKEGKANIASIKRDIDGLNRDIDGLKKDIGGLKRDIDVIKKEVDRLKTLITLPQRVQAIEDRIKPVVDKFNSDMAKPRTLYENGVRQLAQVVALFDNITSTVLRDYFKGSDELFKMMATLMNLLLNPVLSLTKEEEAAMLANDKIEPILKDIKAFHKEHYDSVNNYLVEKGLSFAHCVEIPNGEFFDRSKMVWQDSGCYSDRIAVLVLSPYYDFPGVNIETHKSSVYPKEK